MRIPKLDVGGRPIAWITREDGALLHCREQITWEADIQEIILRGGYSRRTGLGSVAQSVYENLPSACELRLG